MKSRIYTRSHGLTKPMDTEDARALAERIWAAGGYAQLIVDTQLDDGRVMTSYTTRNI